MVTMQNNLSSFIKTHLAEVTAFGLFIILWMFGCYVHEPWYDELHAWLIAKDAPLGEIVFFLPHIEGHPPFFHLLLALPAKLGIAWQWGLRIGNLCSIAAAYLLIFKSPFPRWIRVTLPFSFFLFYQFSVIARPYSILMLLLFLLAYYFPQKDKRPGLFTSLLGGLCACHLLGLVIACGITLAWLFEIKASQPWGQFFKNLRKDPRFHAMLWLLAWALLLTALLYPTLSITNFTANATVPGYQRLFYVLFLAPADTVVTNLLSSGYLVHMQASFIEYTNAFLISSLAFVLLWLGLPRKKILYFVFPYLLTALIMVFCCFRHHLGILLLLFIWYAWISLPSKTYPAIAHHPVFKKVTRLFLILGIVISVAWTVCALVGDAKYPVTDGAEFTQFMKEHHLSNKRVFVDWFHPEKFPKSEDLTLLNFNQPIIFYMGKNIFSNFEFPAHSTYNIRFSIPPEDTPFYLQYWRSQGKPDILLGDVPLHRIFPEEKTPILDYTIVYQFKEYNIWKFDPPSSGILNVYVRNDLLDKYNLHGIKEIPTIY